LSALSKYGRFFYGVLFLVSGLYAFLLFATAASGRQNARNTIVFGCLIVFITRAWFVTRDTLLRPAHPDERPARTPWSTLLTLGDLIVLGSLIATVYVFATSENPIDSPTAPLGLGISIGYLFYLVAVPMRIAAK